MISVVSNTDEYKYRILYKSRNLPFTQALQITLEQVVFEPHFKKHCTTSLAHSTIHPANEYLSKTIACLVLC